MIKFISRQLFFIILSLLMLLSYNHLFGQETRYLNETFNRITTSEEFPPYGWLNIDNDGDGNAWYWAHMDGYNGTGGAGSLSWNLSSLDFTNCDNYLITPHLKVNDINDSIKYWLFSYDGNRESYEIRVSTTDSKPSSFIELLDSTMLNKQRYLVDTAISLEKYIGQNIYIAFVHTTQSDGQEDHLNLILDNIVGPQILPFETDAAIQSLLNVDESGCDIEDTHIGAVLENIGTNAINSTITLHAQLMHITMDDEWNEVYHLSDIVSENFELSIEPNDTSHLYFSAGKRLPYSNYIGSIYTSIWFTFEDDQYNPNDTTYAATQRQSSAELPYSFGFESTDPETAYWAAIRNAPQDASGFKWQVGQNPAFAYKGSNYAVFGVEAPWSEEAKPYDGSKDYFGSRCVYLEAGKSYRIQLKYKFRIGNACTLKLIYGKDLYHLDEHNTLISSHDLNRDREVYNTLGSDIFKVSESGTYHIGIMATSEPVATSDKDWMIFIDDFLLQDSSLPNPIDLSLDNVVNLPLNCDLSDEETLSVTYSNNSLDTITSYTLSYKINSNEEVKDVINDPILPGKQKQHDFATKADMSSHSDYTITFKISADIVDANPNNNTHIALTANEEVRNIPFVDDFETYEYDNDLEENWTIINGEFTTWFLGVGEEGTGFNPAYSGLQILAHHAYMRDANDWCISKCYNLSKDSTYIFEMAYRIDPNTEAEGPKSKLRIGLTSDYDIRSFGNEFFKNENITNTEYILVKENIRVEQSGTYHLAFNAYSEANALRLMIDAVKLHTQNVSNDKLASNESISVFPNPARDKVSISSSNKIETVGLYSVLGKKVKELNLNSTSNNCILNISGLENGLYLLKVTTDLGTKTEKLIIK